MARANIDIVMKAFRDGMIAKKSHNMLRRSLAMFLLRWKFRMRAKRTNILEKHRSYIRHTLTFNVINFDHMNHKLASKKAGGWI